MKALSCKPSLPPSELNALAPLRVGGLAQAILDNAEDPAKVRELASDLLELEPHLLGLLVASAEGTPELT